MSSWHIRAAEPRDVPELARLAGELGYPSTVTEIAARLARVAADPEHLVLVAEDANGRVGGWVHVFMNKLLESDVRAEIGGLVADPALRRRGIGRNLMAHAEARARERRLPMVSLQSNIRRTEAHQFYERLGYTVAKTQLNFRKELPGPPNKRPNGSS